jgi:hypothetical protein
LTRIDEIEAMGGAGRGGLAGSRPQGVNHNVDVSYGSDDRELEVVMEDRRDRVLKKGYKLKDSMYSLGGPIAKRKGGVKDTPKTGKGILKG